MTTHARTERLLLRNWSMTDVDAYAGIVADPEVMRYIGDGKPRGRGHAEAFVRTMMRHQEERGWMRFAIEHAASGHLIGFSGFDEKDGRLDFGWRLGREFWGGGYGFEACSAALWVGRTSFGLTGMTAQSYPENAGSVRIMQKMGMSELAQKQENGRTLVVYGFPEDFPRGFDA
ncbi:MAG: N-acetyltransferase [Bacteroidetes bacterium]|nr:N-acetyltransferase [Bacteroidota bacterium]